MHLPQKTVSTFRGGADGLALNLLSGCKRDPPKRYAGFAFRPTGVLVEAFRPTGVLVEAFRPTGVLVEAFRPTGVLVEAFRPTGVLVEALLNEFNTG